MPPNYDAGYSNPNQNQGLGGFYDPTAYTDSSFAPDKTKPGIGASTGNEFEDEPPLLEGRHYQRFNCIDCLIVVCLFVELGINPNHIFQKVSLLQFCHFINFSDQTS